MPSGVGLTRAHPEFAAFIVKIEIGIEERVKRALDGWIAARFGFVLFERFHSPAARNASAPCKNCLEQIGFVLEVVVQQRRMDPNALRDISQGDAVESVP